MPARATKPQPRPKQPTVVVIAGPNGAGKSTAAPYLLKDALGILELVKLATQRVALRVKLGGHNIPTEDIARRFQRSLHNLFDLYLPLADRWRVLNNATGALTSIARGTAHRTYVEDPHKWLNLQRLGQ